jgi:hypothetical protein
MGTVATARAIAALLGLACAVPANAEELALTCALRSSDPSDAALYPLAIRIDLDRKAVLDVAGDGGVGWIVDVLTETRIEAHFHLPTEIGGFTLNRAAGTIDTISAYRAPVPFVVQGQGACVASTKRG